MAASTPDLYLGTVVRLLVGTRSLGPAARQRPGFQPYSVELDYRNVDSSAAQQVIAWAREQAPYADIQLASPIGATPVTIYAQVMPVPLAQYLAGQVILHATGQTWETASAPLRQLVQQAIDDTIGAGGDWGSFVARMHATANLMDLIAAAENSGEYLPPPPPDIAHKRET
jgi:hypothetical protein